MDGLYDIENRMNSISLNQYNQIINIEEHNNCEADCICVYDYEQQQDLEDNIQNNLPLLEYKLKEPSDEKGLYEADNECEYDDTVNEVSTFYLHNFLHDDYLELIDSENDYFLKGKELMINSNTILVVLEDEKLVIPRDKVVLIHGILDNHGTIYNYGNIMIVGSGRIENNPNSFINNHGSMAIKDGSLINHENATFTNSYDEGSIDNNGVILLYDGSVFSNNSSLLNRGLIDNKGRFVNKSYVNNYSIIENKNIFYNEFMLNNDGSIINNGKIENYDTINNNNTITNYNLIHSYGKSFVYNYKNGLINNCYLFNISEESQLINKGGLHNHISSQIHSRGSIIQEGSVLNNGYIYSHYIEYYNQQSIIEGNVVHDNYKILEL